MNELLISEITRLLKECGDEELLVIIYHLLLKSSNK
jgi:hypothetical protein